MYTTIEYYNGTDYGTICLDLMYFIETGSQAMIRKLFRSVVNYAEDRSSLEDFYGDLFVKISEIETTIDMMEAAKDHGKEYKAALRLLKRFRLAKELCCQYVNR